MGKNYFSVSNLCVASSCTENQKTQSRVITSVENNFHRCFLLILLFLFIVPSYAQVTIGTSTTTQIYPLGNVLGFERSAALYLGSEVGSGSITKLAWYSNNTVSDRPIVIYLKSTSATTLSASTWTSQTSNATLVYSGTISPIAGWNTITLNAPFAFDSSSGNLVVLVEANSGGSGLGASSNSAVRYSAANFRHMFYRGNNTAPATNGVVNSARPNLQISFASAAVAPSCATTFQPASGASLVPRNSIVSWQPGDGQPESYDVFFGTNASPAFIGNQTTTSFSPGLLQANTQYFWKIIPRNTNGIPTSCVVSNFTTSTDVSYCTSSPISNDNLGITNITLGQTNFSNPDVTYSNFENPTSVSRATNANLQVTFATGVTYNTNVWVDYNNDGEFSNANELVFQGNSVSANPTTLNASFFIPESVALGEYKMRIGTADIGQATPNPCYSGSYGVTVDMMLNVIEALPMTPECATTYLPNNGSSNITLNPTLTWNAATGNPSSYDIFFGTNPNPSFHSNVSASITSFTPTAPLQSNQLYYWKIVSKNSFGEASNCSVQVFMTGNQLQYCTPIYSNSCSTGDFIQNFAINTLNNTASGCNGNTNNYINYPANGTTTTALGQGVTYNATVKIGSNAANVAIFIDFNKNGAFESNERFAATSLLAANSSRVIPVIIPENAEVGEYRMRVRSVSGFTFASVDACAAATYGEIEDYTITVIECNAAIWYADVDNDGFGNSDVSTTSCEQPEGYVLIGGDCDDADASVYQSAALYIDQDGDGFNAGMTTICYGAILPEGYSITTLGVDCNDDAILYADGDGDGYGSSQISGCGVVNSTDCDDTNADVFQLQQLFLDADNDGYHSVIEMLCTGNEVPQGYSLTTLGEDCNDSQILYADVDGDGYGAGEPTSCGVTTNTDCDDNDANVFQSQMLYIDLDNDGFHGSTATICFGSTVPQGYSVTTSGEDCDDTLLLYADVDGDGYGAGAQVACGLPSNTDCDDTNASSHQSLLLYVDADSDGYHGGTLMLCVGEEIPSGYSLTTLGADCDDQNSDVYRNEYVFIDADGDGHDGGIIQICFGDAAPQGFSLQTLGSDCNDQDAQVWNGAVLFADADGDGYHASSAYFCYGNVVPQGYIESSFGNDCDDANQALNPGATEILYNGIDENCNGQLDEGFQLLTTVKENQCGVTLANIYTSVQVYPIANTTAYRFRITNLANNDVSYIVSAASWFQFTALQNFAYGNSYSVAVELQIAGTWVGYYGDACTVSLPLISGSSAPTIGRCGETLEKLYTVIPTTSLPYVSGYKYRITNLSQPGSPYEVQILERTQSFFSLTMLQSYNYGETYAVEVAIKTGTEYSDYGAACTISTPSVNPIIRQCGAVYTNRYASVNAGSIPYVTAYKFRVTNLSTNQVQVLTPAVSWFQLSSLQDFSFSTNFSVEVSVKVAGDFSAYGPVCIITTPPAAKANTTIGSSELLVKASPNPFTNSFVLNVSASQNSKSQVLVYDMLGKLIESREIDSQTEFIELGERYTSGVYSVLVTQNEHIKTIKMIKR